MAMSLKRNMELSIDSLLHYLVFSLVLTGQSTSEIQILPENNRCKKEQ